MGVQEEQLENRSGEQDVNFILKDREDVLHTVKVRRRGPRTFLIVLLAFLVGSASGFGGGILAINLQKNAFVAAENQITGQTISPVTKINTSNTLDIGTAISQQVMPSVVGVKTSAVYNTFFGEEKGQVVGTGVIVDEKGYVLTNSHVVMDGNASEITIQLMDGTDASGELLWYEAALDLAIVKIEGEGFQAAALGDSEDIQVGSFALAIGNPLGMVFERTVTQGIISGLNRDINIENQSMEGLIQTDASINEGNSGGPLINSKGEVIGINTVKVKTGEGLGFAIPINTAKPIVDEFKGKGQFNRAYIGIKGTEVERVLSMYPGVDIGTEEGVYVYHIFEGSPAAEGGLREKDIIVGMNGQQIESMSRLSKELYKFRPGDMVELEIIRNKTNRTISIQLTEMPAS